MITSWLFLSLSIFLQLGTTSKILGVFPSPGYSQFILCEKLMTELARRGHDVTVISPFKPNKPVKNYKTVLADSHVEKFRQNRKPERFDINVFSFMIRFYAFADRTTKSVLSEESVQELIHSNETFDLIIVEQFGNEALMGFASLFKAPLISFSSIGLSEWTSDLVGNVRLPSVDPMQYTKLTSHMDFWQRVQNTAVHVFDCLYRQYFHYPKQDAFLKQYFPGNLALDDVMNKVDLVLMNSHVTTTDPSLLTNAVIEIGGFHVTADKLQQDLKKFLDEAEHGAIFFSMGSNLKSTDFSNEKLDAILKVFGKLKQRIVWKFENDKIEYNKNKLYISKWLPQSDILAHPNVVAFITHSGLLSTTEAIYHGVPMIGIPIFADQKMNIKRVVEKHIGVELAYSELSEKSLGEALKEILDNPLYRESAKRFSSIIKHQPFHPLDLALYWVEHIIRYKGGSHLRNSSLELNWFQLYLLDVVSFFIISFIVINYLLYVVMRFVFCRRIIGKKLKKR